MKHGRQSEPPATGLDPGAMKKLPLGGVALLAFDADEGGEKLTEEARAFAPSGRELRRVVPGGGKDWNQVLKNRLGLA